jgi:hypothetical protein
MKGSPVRYRTLFYTYTDDSLLSDFTNWINIPPPALSVSISANPVDLTVGGKATTYLTINSTSGLKPRLNFLRRTALT